jgi:hypothetical protein
MRCNRSYFEGDFWPNVFEDKIKEIKAEEEADGEEDASGKGGKKEGGKKKGSSKKSKSKGASNSKGKSSSKKGKVSLAKGEEDLADRCLELLEKHKDVFFIAYVARRALCPARLCVMSNTHCIGTAAHASRADADPTLSCYPSFA